jgi:RNA-directed DNA polymerase
VTVGAALGDIIVANGFQVNEAKSRLAEKSQRQLVTGLVVNETPNIPRDYVRRLRNILYIWRTYGEAAAASRFFSGHDFRNRPEEKESPAFPLIIRGKVQYVGHVKGRSNAVYLGLARLLSAADPSFTYSFPPDASPAARLYVFVEGRTDRLHLRAACRWFRDRGEFTEVDVDCPVGDDTKGDQQLLKACRLAAVTPHSVPRVFVFDRDNPAIIKDAADASDGTKDWGGHVHSVVLPVPPHRASEERLCIELLYSDEVLKRRDSEGRRIYPSAEFDANSGHHVTEDAYCTAPRAIGLIREDVYDASGKRKLSLSKTAFAEAIHGQLPPFADVSFEGFRGLLEVFARLVKSVPPP